MNKFTKSLLTPLLAPVIALSQPASISEKTWNIRDASSLVINSWEELSFDRYVFRAESWKEIQASSLSEVISSHPEETVLLFAWEPSPETYFGSVYKNQVTISNIPLAWTKALKEIKASFTLPNETLDHYYGLCSWGYISIATLPWAQPNPTPIISYGKTVDQKYAGYYAQKYGQPLQSLSFNRQAKFLAIDAARDSAYAPHSINPPETDPLEEYALRRMSHSYYGHHSWIAIIGSFSWKRIHILSKENEESFKKDSSFTVIVEWVWRLNFCSQKIISAEIDWIKIAFSKNIKTKPRDSWTYLMTLDWENTLRHHEHPHYEIDPEMNDIPIVPLGAINELLEMGLIGDCTSKLEQNSIFLSTR